MTGNTQDTATIAGEAFDWFETRTRDDDTTYTAVKDEAVPKKRGRARIFYSLGERPIYRDFDDPRKTRTPGYGNPWGKEFGDD